MGPTRIAILIVAAVCSIGLAFLVVNMMGHKPAPPAPVAVADKPMARVLVAQRDLKVGERVSPDMLGWQAWPPEAVNETFITDGAARTGAAGVASKVLETVGPGSPAVQSVEGSIVREPILAHEPILQRKLVRGGQGGFMSVMLQPGMRAMSIPVTVESGAGGFILPNDRVDVILNQKVDVKNKDDADGGHSVSMAVSRTVLRNLRVLAIDQTTEPAKGAVSIVGAVATLEVPAADAELLASAKTQGDLMLSLRAYTDGAGAPGRAVPAATRTDTVRVYRGGTPTDVMVQQ
jgi:pilus assembly protein CpaB